MFQLSAYFLADPPLIYSCVSVRMCVRLQLTKLFNISGSGWDIFLKSFLIGDFP